jgi:hypothetical protein
MRPYTVGASQSSRMGEPTAVVRQVWPASSDVARPAVSSQFSPEQSGVLSE